MKCFDCQKELDEVEVAVSDGLWHLCPECARSQSEIMYKRLSAVFDASREIDRKAFALYGNDDFFCKVHKELNND